jgi:hypothetical protein
LSPPPHWEGSQDRHRGRGKAFHRASRQPSGRGRQVQSHRQSAARSANPRFAFVRGRLAAAYALKGETDRAVAELAEARRLSGDGRFASIASLKAARSWGVPKIRAREAIKRRD